MAQHAVIELNNVTVSYGHRVILDDINFKLESGDFTYLIGETGAGKSSFLRLLYRDLIPDQGSISVADMEVSAMADKNVPYLRRHLGVVFQDFQLLPDRSIYENVAFALKTTGQKRDFIKQRVVEVLSMVGLSHQRNYMPDDLSGGEQQRVVIARALANEPRILLADEPTGNLDPSASADIMKLLQDINNRGMSVLMVTHDYDTVKQFPHKTLKIENGKLHQMNAVEL